MTTTNTLMNPDELRARFPQKLKRHQVLELAQQLGLSLGTARCLIEGPRASLQGRTYGNQTRGKYFDREEAIKHFT